MSAKEEEKVELCLETLEFHQKNKWVVSLVHINSVRRLGSYDHGNLNNEIITYLQKHHQKIFGWPAISDRTIMFNSFYVEKMKKVYQEQTLTHTADTLMRYRDAVYPY